MKVTGKTQGSVKHWSYTIGGNSVSIKETMESMDEENRSITFGFGWGGAERLQELQVYHASDTKGGGLLGEMDR
ncbi:hypothetical protein CK203_070609 [Vitis vinifera]|uniref:Bet v I/Major latex protein domain-containing protein n=1 Tax=Vitis vinifera TaxID=29760 RepID=A0A438C130_VITVI|nr:hypothetical protein CK203_070609 [Vitis vinifera]